jgi:hypothetical protein
MFTRSIRGELSPWGLHAVVINPGQHKTQLGSLEAQKAYAMRVFDRATPEAKVFMASP